MTRDVTDPVWVSLGDLSGKGCSTETGVEVEPEPVGHGVEFPALAVSRLVLGGRGGGCGEGLDKRSFAMQLLKLQKS